MCESYGTDGTLVPSVRQRWAMGAFAYGERQASSRHSCPAYISVTTWPGLKRAANCVVATTTHT